MRRRPYSVVLFDEIEKAHHDVFNILLQVLDDGRSDRRPGSHGRFQERHRDYDVEHRQPPHSGYRGAFEGQDYRAMKDAVLAELRHAFRPEFLNRLDEIIVFHALSEEHLKQIVEIQLAGLRARLAERHVTLELTDAARTWLVRSGYDPNYGARPLKRAIQREIETPLAKRILAGDVRDGQTIGSMQIRTGRVWSFSTEATNGGSSGGLKMKRRL